MSQSCSGQSCEECFAPSLSAGPLLIGRRKVKSCLRGPGQEELGGWGPLGESGRQGTGGAEGTQRHPNRLTGGEPLVLAPWAWP